MAGNTSSVAILMGSKSDMEVANKAYTLLKKHGITVDMQVLSAHRNIE